MSQSTDIVAFTCNAKVRQQDSALFGVVEVGDHNVRGFDIAVQQAVAVGVVQADATALTIGITSSCGIPAVYLFSKLSGVAAVDIVHRDPKATVVLAAVPH